MAATAPVRLLVLLCCCAAVHAFAPALAPGSPLRRLAPCREQCCFCPPAERPARCELRLSDAGATPPSPAVAGLGGRTLLKARLMLLATAMLWGTYPVSMKLIYAAPGATLTPIGTTAIRFAVMALAAQVVLLVQARAPAGGGVGGGEGGGGGDTFWRSAFELGAWGCAGTQLNSMGLQQLSAVRVTLILATVNILTPALAAIFGTSDSQRSIPRRTWLACALCLVSTVQVSPASPLVAAAASRLSPPDGCVLAASLCYAMCKVRLGSFVERHPPARLAAGRLQTQALLSFALLGLLGTLGGIHSFGVGALLRWASRVTLRQAALLVGSALLPGVIATLLQAAGQRVVPAASAQPIFALMPVFAALWAFFVLHEPISPNEAMGGLGTVAAAVIASSATPGSPSSAALRASVSADGHSSAAGSTAETAPVPTRSASQRGTEM
ncbi:hypothetical protein EMIHUDRAFT_98337 [Emiliania huxleyi CCMP1516]|uniref:EamA domain-containing protein n=2 Tax=Emiliania huxleyi TaxID=2903 RepID=A0A0D3KMG6_EMIH1|nr:hypothetical protein EMIHUDRAFT_98337 [Emiliania huxleyi CCMP1516]EOD36951.1 hypothetical protein EMIHUDRAFT_98337 [Emiliania huxleyi CCMP1516]|eukprot:XP_005789380.1 hypothetical protein EMIHUDRAFT_98337 [Emiliania huxleyi CCMP1516]